MGVRPRISRKRVASWLKDRFFLRLHMFWILTGTFLGGLLTTKVLFETEVRTLWVRYSISVMAGYVVFLILIRLWLWYIGRAARPVIDGDSVDVAGQLLSHLDITGPIVDGPGGEFGGAGATGSWGEAVVDSGHVSEGTTGSELPGCLDVDEGLAVVLLIALILALLLAGIYVIWAAPAILAEAAFEAALAAALTRSAKRIDRPWWVGSVTRATAWPFIGVLILAIAIGVTAQEHCPHANRLRDVFTCADRR
jgi:hypothetical protein